MSQEDTITTVHPDALELAAILRPAWPSLTDRLRASGVPLCEGDDDGEGDGGDEGGGDGSGDDGSGDDGRDTFGREYVEKLRRENAAARKRAQEAEARVKEFEEKDLSESEKLQREAEEARARGESGTQKLRTANLILALGEKGLTAGRAKAAAKLITVDFDDNDEPKNLDAALKSAATTYGGEMFAADSRRTTSFDGGSRDGQVPAGDMDASIRRAAGRG